MTVYLCATCSTSFADADSPPAVCPICADERQYVPASGQGWLTREQLANGHRNAWAQLEPGLLSVQSVPAFAINQRAILLQTSRGNVLWDCIALIDDATEQLLRGIGGIGAIAISHPHYYSTMQDWAERFDAPVYLHAADRNWVQRPSQRLQFWDGERQELLSGVTLLHLGGHFAGSGVLHWSEGDGVLLVGDTLQVAPGARRVSAMWSYPNQMPLPPGEIRRIADTLEPWRFERIYGAFAGQDMRAGAKGIVAHSLGRYAELTQSAGQPVPEV